MANFSYEIKTELGVVSENKKGWTKELNLVSWSGRTPKYDIRDWAPEHTQMGKGITLTEEELRELGELISREIRRLDNEGTGSSTHMSKLPKKEKTQKDLTPKKIESAISELQKSEPDISGAVNFDDM